MNALLDLDFARGQVASRIMDSARQLPAAVLLLAITAVPAQGQGDTATPLPQPVPAELAEAPREPADEPAGTDATMQLDIARLLADATVDGQGLSDPVWSFETNVGSVLTLLPLRITPGTKATEFSRPEIQIDGGRFLAWWVPDETANANVGSRNQPRRGGDEFFGNPAQTPRFVAGDSRFAHLLGDPNADPTGGAFDEPRVDTGEPDTQGPRLARSVTVTPDGTITWNLDRAIPNAEPGTGDGLYLLKISPQRMQELAPGRPERVARNAGESTQAYNQRRQAAMAETRAEQDEYRAIRAAVQALPETFEAPLPAVVWAVFERREGRPQVSFSGPAPLPWSLPAESFDAMRALAGGGSRGGGFSQGSGEGIGGDDAAAIAALEQAVASGHPLSLRAAAAALSGSDLIGRAQPGDAVSRLVRQILTSDDGPALRIAVDGLAAVNPPTPATNQLLTVAAQTTDPLAKLAALEATLRSNVDDPTGVARVVQQADAVLQDPNGPPPAYVLAGLIRTTENQPVARQALMAGVRFNQIPQARRAEAIRFIAANAQVPDGLAAGWLDSALLGSNDRVVVRQTLEILADAGGGPSLITPLTRELQQLVFGASDGTPAASAEGPAARYQLPIENIALTSSSHGLFNALQSGDPEVRDLAWQALRQFTITDARGRGNAEGDDALSAILAAATAQPTTPPSLVTFLQRQVDGSQATAALMRLAAIGDGRLAGRAVRALLKKPSPFADPRTGRNAQPRQFQPAMRELDPGLRVGFAQAVYTHAGGGATPVSGLAADDRAATWFAGQLEDGVIPDPSAWVEAVGGESAAIDLAGGGDDVIAHGALAALAAAAGADTVGQLAVIDQLGAAPRAADDLQTRWPEVKTSIQITQLDSAVGDYRVTVEITAGAPAAQAGPALGAGFDEFGEFGPGFEEAGFQAPPPGAVAVPADSTPVQPMKAVLGIVELIVENNGVRLKGDPITLTIPDDHLALRIADPLQLRNFPSEDLQDVPLEQATPPLDLLHGDDGAWRGTTDIGGTHTLRVVMEPT